MPTKYVTPKIVVGRITSKRIAAILAELRERDRAAARKTMSALTRKSRQILLDRAGGAERREEALWLAIGENAMRDLERAALADLLEGFRTESRCGLVWGW